MFLPESRTALMLGDQGGACFLRRPFRRLGAGAERAVPLLVGTAPVHIQITACAELHAANVAAAAGAHWRSLAAEHLTQLGALRVPGRSLGGPGVHRGNHGRGGGLVHVVAHGLSAVRRRHP